MVTLFWGDNSSRVLKMTTALAYLLMHYKAPQVSWLDIYVTPAPTLNNAPTPTTYGGYRPPCRKGSRRLGTPFGHLLGLHL